MRFKVVVHKLISSEVEDDSTDLSEPMDLADAQRRLAELIEGKSARATSDGWICQAIDGSRYVVSLERCQPENLRGERLAAIFHQARV